MRTFHTSGSCNLKVNNEIVDFIYKELEDMYIDPSKDNSFIISFKSPIPSNLMADFEIITGFQVAIDDTRIVYDYEIKNVENDDVTKAIKNINNLLRLENKDPTPVTEVYENYIKEVLEVGDIYSTFIELVLCNMYLTKDKEILRYAVNRDINEFSNITTKLSPKHLHKAVSKLLGLLYEPNAGSISKFASLDDPLLECANTVLERLWTGAF